MCPEIASDGESCDSRLSTTGGGVHEKKNKKKKIEHRQDLGRRILELVITLATLNELAFHSKIDASLVEKAIGNSG